MPFTLALILMTPTGRRSASTGCSRADRPARRRLYGRLPRREAASRLVAALRSGRRARTGGGGWDLMVRSRPPRPPSPDARLHDPSGRDDRPAHPHGPDADLRLSTGGARAVPGDRSFLGDLPAHGPDQAAPPHSSPDTGSSSPSPRSSTSSSLPARRSPTTKPAPTAATRARSANRSRRTTRTRARSSPTSGHRRTLPAGSGRWGSASAGTSRSARR